MQQRDFDILLHVDLFYKFFFFFFFKLYVEELFLVKSFDKNGLFGNLDYFESIVALKNLGELQ